MRVFVIVLGSVGLAACFPTPTPVPAFSRTYSCPAHRIVVTAQADSRGRELACASQPKDSDLAWCGGPPVEIAQDPGRVAIWEHQRDAHFAHVTLDTTLVEAVGCGERSYYACDRWQCKAIESGAP